MTVFWRLLQELVRVLVALRDNTTAVKEQTAAIRENTAASIALAVEVKALREALKDVPPVPMAQRVGDPEIREIGRAHV